MDESIDPELSVGGTSHAGGKHQAGGTSPAGKHQAERAPARQEGLFPAQDADFRRRAGGGLRRP